MSDRRNGRAIHASIIQVDGKNRMSRNQEASQYSLQILSISVIVGADQIVRTGRLELFGGNCLNGCNMKHGTMKNWFTSFSLSL